MRWMIRVAGLSVAAVLLTVPFTAQAALVRTDDSPPLEGASTMTTTPADPTEGQVVTIIVPAEPADPTGGWGGKVHGPAGAGAVCAAEAEAEAEAEGAGQGAGAASDAA